MRAMDLDTGRVARKPSERKAIVRYVYETKEAIESDWLEWKSEFDLSETRYRGPAAKHILAFANRHPDKAARNAGGVGYLLIGVEPGSLPGVPELWDPEKIESWIAPYVGDRVAWEPAYVEIDHRHVLLIIVEAPQWGDPPFPLRKGAADEYGKTMRGGAVYIRRPGKSDQANAEELDMLTERARERPRKLTLTLEAEGLPLRAISSEVLAEAHREAVIAQMRRRLLHGVPQTRTQFHFDLSEPRSPEEYRSEVEDHLADVRRRWATVLAADVVENERVPLTLVIVNPTDEVFDSVQLEARLPINKSWVYCSASEFRERIEPPEPPNAWGDRFGVMQFDASLPCDVEIETEEKQVLLRFRPILVRPGSRHRLSTVLLALPPSMSGEEILLSWRATSASTPGDDSGVVKLPVSPDPSVTGSATGPDAR